jgi:murein DD-endopeptidase MepM/ murein hydrolase activator NlpD
VRAGLLSLLLLVPLAATASPALASDEGGVHAPDSGGLAAGERAREARGPRLVVVRVAGRTLLASGAPLRVAFRVGGPSGVRIRLVVRRAGRRGAPLRVLALGLRRRGALHEVLLTGREGGELPEGAFELSLSGRDERGQRVRSGEPVRFTFRRRIAPLAGPLDLGGPGARFGAPRAGHAHEGHDLVAPAGTPVLAPRGGTVQAVGFQAAGAGHYVVLAGEHEALSYVFMHLEEGSVAVRTEDRVPTGATLGRVGSTGASSGPHLHFEVWRDGWRSGRAIDPLPLLSRWAGVSPPAL